MPIGDVVWAPTYLLRLFTRWFTLVALLVVAMTLVIPAIFIGDSGFAILAGERSVDGRDLAAAARQLVLHAGVLVPLVLAAQVSAVAFELQATSVSWTLPGLRRKMLSGHVLLMLVTATIVGVGAALRTDRGTALLAAALVPFWYAVGASLWEQLQSPRRFALLLPVILVGALRPTWYTEMVTSPTLQWGCIVLAVVASGWLLLTKIDPALSRAFGQHVAVRSALPHVLMFGPLINHEGATVSGVRGATRRSLLQWVHAAVVEHARSIPAALRGRVFVTALVSIFLYLTNSFVVILGITFAQAGLQLSGLFMYPLTRRQRADVQFLCCLVDVAVVTVVVIITFSLLEVMGVDRTRFNSLISGDWRVHIAAIVAFAPLAQWGRALGPIASTTSIVKRSVPNALFALVSVLSLVALRRVLGNPPTSVALAYFAGVALLVHAAHFAALRYVYARRDLRVS